jgi:hypothetical protein
MPIWNTGPTASMVDQLSREMDKDMSNLIVGNLPLLKKKCENLYGTIDAYPTTLVSSAIGEFLYYNNMLK